MVAVRKPRNKDYEGIVTQIYEISRSVSSITPRTKKFLLHRLYNNDISLAYDGNKLVGWLVSIPYSKTVQELGMAYIDPEYRSEGILTKLVEGLIDNRPLTVVATYESILSSYLTESWGFKISSFSQVMNVSKGKFLLTRITSVSTVKAVLSHLLSKRPIYLIRDANDR